MKSASRLCMLVMVFALLAGCGDDGDDDPTVNAPGSTTTLIPPVTTRPGATTTSTTAASGRTTTSAPIRGVTDGAVCSPNGATGVTNNGIAMVCAQIAGGSELRWRPA